MSDENPDATLAFGKVAFRSTEGRPSNYDDPECYGIMEVFITMDKVSEYPPIVLEASSRDHSFSLRLTKKQAIMLSEFLQLAKHVKEE
jgi:hypothetical protein